VQIGPLFGDVKKRRSNGSLKAVILIKTTRMQWTTTTE
jgi:hypothetical protein